MTLDRARMRSWSGSVLLVAALAACETTQPKPDVQTTSSSTSSTSPSSSPAPAAVPAPAGDPPAPPSDAATATVTAAEPPAPPPPPPPPPPPVNKDGIDDDNWLPTNGGARDAFLSAVERARTDPSAAVSRFVDAAGQATYFYAAWFNAGAAAQDAGDLSNAEKYYREALKVRPDYGPALANLAILLERTGRGAEAQRLVDDAARKMPEKAGPHLAVATLAWLRKDADTVEREALTAIKYDERNVAAMRLMGMLFRSQGRLDTARFALENALQVEPGNALLHLELGYVLAEQKDDKAAIVAFEKAARLRPTLLEAQDNYGVLLLRYGMANEAVRAFEQAVRLDPKSSRAQLHLGNGLRATKQYPQAEAAYRKALELDPQMTEAYFNLGVLYIDNPLPGIDELDRLQKGMVALKDYKAKAKPEGATLARLDEYIETTDKRVQKELKRRAREERRKREEAAASAPENAGGDAGKGQGDAN